MRKFETRLLCVSIAVLILAGAATGALAQSPFNYRGCLKARGKLKKLIRGLEPVKPCKLSEVEIGLASADTTDALQESLSTVIDLANGVDDRLEYVEMQAAKIDGKVFMDDFNTAFGKDTLTGSGLIDNTAVGAKALQNMTRLGIGNTAVGKDALKDSQDGLYNTAVGRRALWNLVKGNRNTAIGANAGSLLEDGSENIYINSDGENLEDDTIRIGTSQVRTFIAGIAGTGVEGVPVLVSSSGQLGIMTSSRRYKKNIEPLGELSRDLMRLRPVAYRYKEPNAQGQHPLQYGLIAEEVAAVYPDLVAYSADGRAQAVKYHKLNSLLLNELQKQHQKIRQQEELIAKLVARLDQVEAKLAD